MEHDNNIEDDKIDTVDDKDYYKTLFLQIFLYSSIVISSIYLITVARKKKQSSSTQEDIKIEPLESLILLLIISAIIIILGIAWYYKSGFMADLSDEKPDDENIDIH